MQRLFTVHCNVYQSIALGDCTNNGVTGGKVAHAILIGPDNPDPEATFLPIPVLRLQARPGGYLFAIPIKPPDTIGGEPMWGGNFVFAVSFQHDVGVPYPIPVHDRFEPASWSQGMD